MPYVLDFLLKLIFGVGTSLYCISFRSSMLVDIVTKFVVYRSMLGLSLCLN